MCAGRVSAHSPTMPIISEEDPSDAAEDAELLEAQLLAVAPALRFKDWEVSVCRKIQLPTTAFYVSYCQIKLRATLRFLY